MGLMSANHFSTRLMVNGVDMGSYVVIEQVNRDFLEKRGWDYGALFVGDIDFTEVYTSDRSQFPIFESDERWQIKQELNWNLNQSSNPLQHLLQVIALPLPEFEKQIEAVMDVDSYLRWRLWLI